jgi:hypothetical protein
MDPHRSQVLTEGHLMAEALRVVYHRFRERYNERIPQEPFSQKLQVLIGCVARAQRLSDTIEAVSKGRLDHEAYVFLRAPTENIVNLFYILYAGPRHERRSTEDLAARFLHYASIRHWQFMHKNPALVRKRFDQARMGRFSVETWLTRVERMAKVARGRYGFYSDAAKRTGYASSWCPGANIEMLFERVMEHLPKYAQDPEEFWQFAKASLTAQNSGLHGDSYSHRGFWRDESTGSYFDDIRAFGTSWSDAAAMMGYWSLSALAEHFHEQPSVEALFRQEVERAGEEMRRKLASKQ